MMRFGRFLVLLALAAGIMLPLAGYAASEERSMQVNGSARSYRVYRPPNLSASAKAPLVVVLHGGFGTGADAEQRYGWDEAADRNGFMVAYPDGLDRAWNAGGGCCGKPMRQNVDDAGFLDRMLQTLIQQGADPKRIYVTGMSNGGAMSYRYACQGMVPVAAIGIISGALTASCANPQKLSLIAIHGSADQHIPIAGGVGTAGVMKISWPSYENSVETFRKADACGIPATLREGAVTRKSATCGQYAITQITIDGAGHQWPGSKANERLIARLLAPDPPSRALDATQVLTEFFLADPRP